MIKVKKSYFFFLASLAKFFVFLGPFYIGPFYCVCGFARKLAPSRTSRQQDGALGATPPSGAGARMLLAHLSALLESKSLLAFLLFILFNSSSFHISFNNHLFRPFSIVLVFSLQSRRFGSKFLAKKARRKKFLIPKRKQ